MMVSLPHGPVLLLEFLPLLIWPLFTAFVVLECARTRLDVPLSLGIRIAVYLLSLPVFAVGKVMRDRIRNNARASKLGAAFPPFAKASPRTVQRELFGDDVYLADFFPNTASELGPVFGFSPTYGQYRTFTMEPQHVKAILATQFDEFRKGPEVGSRFSTLLGQGIFSADGDTWKFHRSIARPFFSKERISDFAIFQKRADDVIVRIARRLSEGQPVEFQDVVARFTLDSATEFLFGRSVDSISAGLPYPESSGIKNPPSFTNHPSNSFVQAFTRSQDMTARRGRLGKFWRLGEFWVDRVKPYRKDVNKYIDPIIDEALKNDIGDVKEHESLLASLLSETKDYQIIQSQLINILVAGRDTTSSTLMFVIYLLSQHPMVLARLREEILNIVGEARPPTYEDIRDMKYLRAVLNETLRLYPIVPINTRASIHATTLPPPTAGGKPVYIPANTICMYSVFWMHRRTDLWGPDAATFDPGRFIDYRLKQYLTNNPWIFLPFNGGPRICLGQQFAYNEMSFFLIRLFQRFSSLSLAMDVQPESSLAPIKWRGAAGTKGTEKIKLALALTLNAPEGLWVRMKEAGQSEMAK